LLTIWIVSFLQKALLREAFSNAEEEEEGVGETQKCKASNRTKISVVVIAHIVSDCARGGRVYPSLFNLSLFVRIYCARDETKRTLKRDDWWDSC